MAGGGELGLELFTRVSRTSASERSCPSFTPRAHGFPLRTEAAPAPRTNVFDQPGGASPIIDDINDFSIVPDSVIKR
jgi:hypothetical protein